MNLYLLLFLFLAACSHSSRKPEPSQPQSQAPDINFASEVDASRTDNPRALSPISSSSGSLILPTSNDSNAAIGALILGLSYALSTNPQNEDLSGSCLYGDPDNLAITSPCIHVSIKLIDENNVVQATTETNENGNFRFYVPKEKLYSILIEDRKGRSSKWTKKVGRGHTISLFLKP